MFLSSIMKAVPYVGNIVPAQYLVVSKIGPHMDRIMPCNSVRIHREGDLSGLILSQSELTEAHFRYVSYFDALTDHEKNVRLGKVIHRDFLTRRKNSKPVHFMLVYLRTQSGDKIGYLFAPNDWTRILEKTRKVTATIKQPSFIQRILISINVLLGYLDKE